MSKTSTPTSTDRIPSASKHSTLRWQMRGDLERYDFPVCSVWEQAEPVSLNRPHTFTEIRLDEDSQTLLCRRGGTIVTVLRRYTEPIVRSSSSKNSHCAGCHRTHNEDRCPVCGTEQKNQY
jgi:hypothetical protein